MADEKKSSGVSVLKKYFGYLPGQTLKEFAAEVRELSPSDKDELVALANEAMPKEAAK